MKPGRHMNHADLFVLRIWREEGAEAQPGWHGRIQRAVDGEAHEFDDWPELIERLRAMLSYANREAARRSGLLADEDAPDQLANPSSRPH